MLSLEKCKEILEKSGKIYTLEQVKIIRKALYELAEIDFQLFKEGKSR